MSDCPRCTFAAERDALLADMNADDAMEWAGTYCACALNAILAALVKTNNTARRGEVIGIAVQLLCDAVTEDEVKDDVTVEVTT